MNKKTLYFTNYRSINNFFQTKKRYTSLNFLSTLSPIDEKDELNSTSSLQRLDIYKDCKLSTSYVAENLRVRSFSLGGEKLYQKHNKVFFNKFICLNLLNFFLKPFFFSAYKQFYRFYIKKYNKIHFIFLNLFKYF